jgi:hypothetical protein
LFEQRSELLFERADALAEAGAVGVPAALIPSGEQPCGDLEASRAELLLGAEPLAVGGEVPEQVRPTDLAALGLKSVVGPPAIRAGQNSTADTMIFTYRQACL